jgi:prolyl-tRNA synthetase
VPIPPRKGDWNEAVLPKARELLQRLKDAGVRAHLDDRDTHQTGYKYADWEMRGVPLRLEIGPKDIEKDQCVLVRRDNREKAFVPTAGLAEEVPKRLEALQAALLERARRNLEERTTRVSSYDELKEVMRTRRGLIVAGWAGDPAVEKRIKEETKATIRVIPTENVPAPDVVTGEPGREVYFAQAY